MIAMYITAGIAACHCRDVRPGDLPGRCGRRRPEGIQVMDEDDESDAEPANGGFCPKCGGSGRDDFSDGLMECGHCQGEGYEWWN